MKRRVLLLNAAAAMLLMMTACSPGPREIDFGKEECAHCKMTITDQRFAAELVTTKGKVYVYDAVECLAATINAKTVAEDEISSLWVMRYDSPGTFIDAAKAWYLRSEEVRSPMGLNLAAFETEAQYAAAAQQHEGLQYRWLGVRLLVVKEWE